MKVALKLPGGDIISSPDEVINKGLVDLSSILTSLLTIAFYAAVFISFFWLAWGAFAYIMAQGKKEDLEKARARITWALIGLAFTFLAFFIAKFMSEIFKPTIGGVPF